VFLNYGGKSSRHTEKQTTVFGMPQARKSSRCAEIDEGKARAKVRGATQGNP
jgi:hypothetical protein